MTRPALLALAVLAVARPALAQEGAIPPQVAERLGIPPEKVRQVQEMAFAANEQLIGLEADVRRAQLALDREIRSTAPDEGKIGPLVDAVSRAEAALRKNRILLVLRIRRLVGDEAWQKLEAWRAEQVPPRPPGPPGRRPPGEGPPGGGPPGERPMPPPGPAGRGW
ncbi:MAG TPA: hypothetical protein VLS93_01695 [Anaeromyxobacteraceae bacterium]|nr:hypothetical protein [Anaeromyxobacteraceae bacterium]